MKKFIFALLMTAGSMAYAGKYGMAGCGLGSTIFQDQPGKIQIVAALLNDMASQTSAITTGSSNCVPSAGDVADLKYIEDNQEMLKLEIAQGDGETLGGLLELWGCDSAAKSVLKADYASIFTQENKAIIQVSNSMKSSLKNNSCQKI
jgi:hypothetical protein